MSKTISFRKVQEDVNRTVSLCNTDDWNEADVNSLRAYLAQGPLKLVRENDEVQRKSFIRETFGACLLRI